MQENLRTRADGLFAPGAHDEARELVRVLARIDQDHTTRGLHGSTVRLSARHEAKLASLRTTFELRVDSLVDAYGELDRLLDDAAETYLEGELQRIADVWQDNLLEEAERETGTSQLGQHVLQQFESGIRRDVESEHERALQRVTTEIARRPPKKSIFRRFGPKEPKEWFWRIVAAVVTSLAVGVIGWKSGLLKEVRGWFSVPVEHSPASEETPPAEDEES